MFKLLLVTLFEHYPEGQKKKKHVMFVSNFLRKLHPSPSKAKQTTFCKQI